MKMITKTFNLSHCETSLTVNALVNKALADGLTFYFGSHTCCVSAEHATMAFCDTPLALWWAYFACKPITFSITSPARYWK